MKKLILLLAVIITASCTTYKKVQMNYVVNLADHGFILCRDYSIKADTIYLFDAGHYKNQIMQHRVSEIKAIGFKEILIVKIK